jgi:hypothetical protein
MMQLLGHHVRIGMTWDEFVPIHEKGRRISLERGPGEDTWIMAYVFAGPEQMKATFKFQREGLSSYKLIDFTL